MTICPISFRDIYSRAFSEGNELMKRSLLILVLFSCCFLVACGGSQFSTRAGSTPIPLNEPTVLHITRTNPPTDNLGPFDKTVTDVQVVQKLYRAALALPPYPTQASVSQACLTDPEVIYHLIFLHATTEVQRMNLDPGSCMQLAFSSTDLRQVNNAFLTLFKQAIQVNELTSN
jgi:hypothetical protein